MDTWMQIVLVLLAVDVGAVLWLWWATGHAPALSSNPWPREAWWPRDAPTRL